MATSINCRACLEADGTVDIRGAYSQPLEGAQNADACPERDAVTLYVTTANFGMSVAAWVRGFNRQLGGCR